MLAAQTPILKDIVLIGAGHAHVGVLRNFGMKPVPGVRLTLISREVDTPYSGMLPGLIAGHYSFDETHIDTGPLCRFARARLYRSEVTGLDLTGKRVLCADRPPVPYDLLSIDIGSTPNTRDVPGAAEAAIPVKPIDGFLKRFEAARQRVLDNAGKARICVVGAGAGGVELTLSLERRLRRDIAQSEHDPAGVSFSICTSDADILSAFPKALRERFRAILEERRISVAAGHRVSRVDGKTLYFDGQAPLAFDEIFWTTQAAAAPWLTQTGLALDEKGFIETRATLESVSHDGVFAAGDVAALRGHPLPKAGVYAVRQGPVLAENLRRAVSGKSLKRYTPQRDVLALISTGEPYAIGTRNGITFEGAWVWRWKDWIDRRFMRKFNELPEMQVASSNVPALVADKEAIKEISAIAMRCGGCGAKVGATVLTRALSEIAPVERGEVLIGLDAPDDAAVVDNGGPRLSVHSVDYFRAIVDDPYMFGKIAANHALGDIYAMGGEPQTALAIATVPYGLERKVEADLSGLMAGANEILREAGCALVGGHTSEGAELALGFSINGLVERRLISRKGGLQPGDALIVTKPIGTGTLLAADMRGRAKARWVMAAVAHMTHSNAAAAHILRKHDVHAATDVTGFGLLGHLVEMVKASGADVTLALNAIPLLAGARETAALGIFSSLQPQNVRLRRAVRNLEEAAKHPLYPLLFDPQTAGGLLAGMPRAEASACVAELHEAGYAEAAIIGAVHPQSGTLEPITIDLGAPAQTEPIEGPATNMLLPQETLR